jgi:hypothetical protein
MKLIKLTLLLMLLVSLAAGQGAGGNAVEVRNVDVVPGGGQLKVEVTLSAPVVPMVIIATHPDRLVLELPNTASSPKQQRAAVNQNGVKAIRIGLNSANPPVTRLVVDLDEPRLYDLATDGKKVILTVLPSETARQRKGEPVPAASGSLLGKLHPQGSQSLPTAATNSPAPVTPPPALPPIKFPAGQTNSGHETTSASTALPSASHPNFGSLQQGTVSPGLGTTQRMVPTANATTTNSGQTTMAPGPAFPEVAVVHGDNPGASKQPGGAGFSTGQPSPGRTTQSSVNTASSTSSVAQAKPATPGPQIAPAVTSTPAAVTVSIAAPVAPARDSKPKAPQPQSAPSAATVTATSGTSTPAAAVPVAQTKSASAASVNSPTAATVAANLVPAAPAKTSAPLPGPKAAAGSATVTTGTVVSAAAPTGQATSATTPAVTSTPLSGNTTASTPAAPTKPSIPVSQPQPQAVAATAKATSPATASVPVLPPTTATSLAAQVQVPQATAKPASGVSTTSTLVAATPAPAAATPPSQTVSSVPASATSASTAKSNPSPTSGQPTTTASGTTPSPAPVATQQASNVKNAPSADAGIPVLLTRPSNSDIRIAFKVKYVAEGVAYLDGGRTAGLTEGLKLVVLDKDPFVGHPTVATVPSQNIIAELEVTAVADTSAVADVHTPKRELKSGDLAYLPSEETQAMIAERSLSATRKYPAVITFTESDTLDEEARAEVPRPPLPEINRVRGRFGFDYTGIVTHGATSMLSSSYGLVARTDFTRIGGTYWNLNGFWRGRLTSTSATAQPTLQDLLNRTYHLGLTYDNPKSPLVAGFGRLYLPWATSLDTIDGGYFGVRPVQGMIVGMFLGSTPDPTSYSYNPNQEIGGTFVNFTGGSWDDFRYSSTTGVGMEMLKWQTDRPFVFAENSISFKRFFSIYHAMQADRPRGNPAVPTPGAGLSRSFFTFRIQPMERIEFDVNHTYFRDLPTFDPSLIGTGLLDKYLFQGYSAGTRVEVLKQVWLYATLGRSNRTGDAKASLNQLYGLTLGHLPRIGIRTDVHYSKFTSAFGSGTYEALSLSRTFGDAFHAELLAGQQKYASALAVSNTSHFVTTNLDTNLGRHYFFMGGLTWNRGGLQNYDQWYLSLGYRFDSKYKGQ